MNEFLWFNFLILLLCALKRMSEGKISRRLQYAMWFTLPAYLLFAAAVELKPASGVVEYISPALSIPIAKLEIAVSGALSSAAARFVESLSAHNIAIDDRLLAAVRFLRYGITALLLLAFLAYNLCFAVHCRRRRRFYKRDEKTGMKLYLLDDPRTPFLLGRSIYIHPDMTQNPVLDDVQRLKMSHIGKSLATVKSVENNPNITTEKKLETAQLETARANGIQARTEAFMQSRHYMALPTEAERAAEYQEHLQKIKDRFTSGDTGGAIRELTPEEAAQRREEARNQPAILSVSADEITANRFSATGDNTTYDVEGVSFSNSEMSGLKEITRNAISMLPTMGSDLDYNAYASIGLAVNMVHTYAAEHLTEEQGAAAMKSMENYIDRLTSAQRFSQSGPTEASYYGEKYTITEAAADGLRQAIAALPGDHSTLLKNISAAQTAGGMTAVATNTELSGNILNDFAKVDLRDKASVKSLFEGYRSKVTHAYREWGLGDTGYDTSLTSKLSNDTELFSNQIAGILSLLDKANGISVDYYA